MSLNTILSEFHQYWSNLAKTIKFLLSPEKLRNLKYDYLTPQQRYLQWRFHLGERVVARGSLVVSTIIYLFVCWPRWLRWMRVQQETRRLRVQAPPSSATFFRGD